MELQNIEVKAGERQCGRGILTIMYVTLVTVALSFPSFAQQVFDDSIANVGEEKARAAMQAVMAKLKDPMAAQFKSFAHPNPMYQQYPKNIVCGMVNGKNGFGGYNGFSPFAYNVLNHGLFILSDDLLNSVGGELVKVGFQSSSCASALGIQQ